MRWLPWRRKQARSEFIGERSGAVAVADRPARDGTASRSIAEPRGAALAFVRDALALSGAQVRVEEPDLLAVTLPDGTRARYTGSLARARGEADATLLVQGGAALGALLDEVALRGGCVAFALPTGGDPVALTTSAISEVPAACGRCASGEDAEHAALCATCPLRAGRVALRGVGGIGAARELRRYESLTVELTYRVIYHDRDGRRDEQHRLAYDATSGEPIAPVALDMLAACAPQPLPSGVDITPITGRAQAELTRTLDAGALLLALRVGAEYQRRLHDLALTHARLLRESPEAHVELEAGHTAERARLADLFSVGVEAELAGVAYIYTTIAEVSVRCAAGGELALAVDLGRRAVLPPCCAVCGAPSRAGTLCAHGHLVCPACAAGADVTAACPACAGEAKADRPARRRRPRARDDAARAAADALTPERLGDLSEQLWQTFMSWYLATEGYTPEAPETRIGLALWRLGANASDSAEDGAGAGWSGCAVAVRPAGGRRLGAADVRAAIDAWRGELAAMTMLVTSAAADAEALREAAAAGVRVVERQALAAFLERMAAAHTTALAEAERDAQVCAESAHTTQVALLGALAALEKEIAGCVNSRRATGRGPLTAATNTVTAALHEAERALLAWDTLIDEWLASFDERAAPDGSLRIVRTLGELRALAERADHLRAALGRPLAALAATPGMGESGYTAWRKALLEQLTAACETLSWRASAVNLEHWRDAASARDAAALAHAEDAAQRAKHTAARTAKARDVLVGRIGL